MKVCTVLMSLGCSVLITSAGACGLISSDITSVKFDLPSRSYNFDTAQAGVNLPAATLLSLPCSAASDCCLLAGGAGIDCGLVICYTDAPSPTCALTATIETPPQEVDLKKEVPALSGFSKQSVIDVTVSKITYDITKNTLNVDLPAVELFVAPAGTPSTSDPMAKRFGTVPVTAAGTTITGGQVQLDAAGQQAFVGFAHNFGTPFVFLGRTTLVVPGGMPIPNGAVALTIKGQLSAKPGL